MITISLHIKDCTELDFIAEKQKNYSCAFRKLYVNSDKIDDKNYAVFLQKKFKLTDMEYRSLQSDVSNKIKQTNTNKSENEQKIIDAINKIKALNGNEKSIKNTRRKFKKHNDIKRFEHSLSQNITFGGKQLLRELTLLHNKKNTEENQSQIKEKTKQWKENRILPFYVIGEANQIGNRFFKFDFPNKTIIYKPFKGKKIEIKYSCTANFQTQLLKLQSFIDKKIIAVTLSVTTKQINITFDNSVLSGFYIDKQERRKEVFEINKKAIGAAEKKEIIKQVYLKYYENLRVEKLKNKVSNRYVS